MRATETHAHPHLAIGEMDWKGYRDNEESYRMRIDRDILAPLDRWVGSCLCAPLPLPRSLCASLPAGRL